MTLDWHGICNRLEKDWQWIGRGRELSNPWLKLAMDCHQIDTGLEMDWFSIGSGLPLDRQWIGKHGMNWQICPGLADWSRIGIGKSDW